MLLEKFQSGEYRQEYKYRSFYPTSINKNWTWNTPDLNVLLEQATQSLSRLDAYSLIVPNVDLFIYMHIVKEANKSSKIEGTQTNIDEVFLEEKDIMPERRDDWKEVNNYIKAINFAIKQLNNIPLSNRLLKDTHKIILDSARGAHKSPGEWRKSQNWIGGSSISDAVFIPPNHQEIGNLLSDLEKFWHNPEINVPHLIKIALSHYQFETIHPFLDGNGRIGRLLITLYLVNFGLLKKPTLYLSDFFEKHRSSYYDALSRVRDSNDIIHWIKFFLNAVINTSDNGIKTFTELLNLKDKLDKKIVLLGRKAGNARKLIEFLYEKPMIKVKDVEQHLSLSRQASNNLVKDFQNLDILQELTGFKRNKIYNFKSYLDLFLKN